MPLKIADYGPQDKNVELTILDKYKIEINDILVDINIVWYEDKPVPNYIVSLTNISDATKLVLEKIRQEFISKVDAKELII